MDAKLNTEITIKDICDGFTFNEYDIIKLKFEDINMMVNDKIIVFIERYKTKFEQWREKYE